MGDNETIITRTPYRISFFGGGTDYPAWFLKHGGCVLSTTIDKYCYVSARWLPPFFEHKHRIVWSQIENINKIDEIHNNIARECMRYLNIENGIAINHDGDLPARSGMGSSSAFTVGLLNALHHLQGETIPPIRLSEEATRIEQDMIKDNVGNQDQIACAVGGLNYIEFQRSGIAICKQVDITPERKNELESHLMMVFTGFPRTASEVAGTYNFNRDEYLISMMKQVQTAEGILISGDDIRLFGAMFNQTWQYKKQLSDAISTPYIDFIYDNAIKAGALGGKILGAGGGGFMLLFCEPEKQDDVRKALKGLLVVPFKFENKGSQVILDNGND